MSRRRGSNSRSTHQEGYDEYSHDDEDEWDESEEDHTTSRLQSLPETSMMSWPRKA